jgi:hypothetical protein
LRIVATESRASSVGGPGRTVKTYAIADSRAVLPGRGAYLCLGAGAARPADECLALATRRGGIPRALRRAIPGGLVLNDSELVESMQA